MKNYEKMWEEFKNDPNNKEELEREATSIIDFIKEAEEKICELLNRFENDGGSSRRGYVWYHLEFGIGAKLKNGICLDFDESTALAISKKYYFINYLFDKDLLDIDEVNKCYKLLFPYEIKSKNERRPYRDQVIELILMQLSIVKAPIVFLYRFLKEKGVNANN